ncbi:MAG: 4Fe-4S dicluster domain-containing protein [Candidatus Lambdaproteobacteria bacterium]|nr:4Fe-4S dicluster domain-containing protein [Candidatus Lambdaproteobacteria bacterium]
MLKSMLARLHQGHRTMAYPGAPPPALPERFRGRPLIDASRCPEGCRECVRACPTAAIAFDGQLRVDLGKCLFCTECSDACPAGAIGHGADYRLATRARGDLALAAGEPLRLAQALERKTLGLFGRSLKLRQVSAGGCNGCESDVNVLTTIGWDLGRFGIQFVASPRHADGLLLTGCVTGNMTLALEKAYAAVAPPKIVIAVGACAISGGPYAGHPQQRDGGTELLPIDLFIPGCPPHPLTILDGLLRLLDRLPPERSATG